jgi:AcrR family transcriptional regulator
MPPQEVTRKRQARGEARMQSLMEAAEAVFSRVGYGKATTNEIAAEAKVSPATLYQFFSNKEELANAIAAKYVKEMEERYANVELESIAKLAVRAMVKALFLPIFEFHETHPAFTALFMDAPLSLETREAKMALSSKLSEHMTRLLMLRNSLLSEADAAYQAEVSMLVFRGFVCDIREARGERREKLVESMLELISTQVDKASV